MKRQNTAFTPESAALLKRVLQAKQLNKLSVEQIAQEAGMFRPTVQNQLYGHYNLDVRVLLAVARLCPNISADYLLRGEGDLLSISTATIDTKMLETLFDRLNNIEISINQLVKEKKKKEKC